MIKTLAYSIISKFIIILGIVLCIDSVSAQEAEHIYKVGLPNVPGLMFRDENGSPVGFPLEITEVLLEKCNVKYEWVDGTWPELFKKVSTGEIDMLPGTQVSDERKNYLDFMLPGVYTMWSEFYVNKDQKFTDPRQLNKQKIGIVVDDNNGIGFINFISSFEVEVDFVYYSSHLEAINGLKRNETFGIAGPKQKESKNIFDGVKSSGLFFNPTISTICFPKGKNTELRHLLGNKLVELKNNPNSEYYTLFQKYSIKAFDFSKAEIPKIIKIIIPLGLFFILIAMVFVILLRREVERKTKELKNAKEKAEESERLKSSFIANMSHEIRTPLNSIIGFSELLVDFDLTDDRKQKYAVIIKQQNKLLLNIINDVIDISKIESGNLKVLFTEIKIGKFLNDLYQSTTSIFDESFQFKLKLDPKFSNYSILTDDLRLNQILNNFLSNAYKYTNGGKVELGVKLINDHYHFYVSDSGPGLSPDQIELIFDRFHKVDNFEQGAGLGLAISKSLALLLGGKIQVNSSIETGSVFAFVIHKHANSAPSDSN